MGTARAALLPLLVIAALPLLQANKYEEFDDNRIYTRPRRFPEEETGIDLDNVNTGPKNVNLEYDPTSRNEKPRYYSLNNDDEDEFLGSGDTGNGGSPSTNGINIRVSIEMREPYDPDFSNPNSAKFQNFSRTLANAVNELYDPIEGDQRASLVRIQTSVNDPYASLVTLDINSVNNNDYRDLMNILKNAIKRTGRLKDTVFSSEEFTYKLHDGPLHQCFGENDRSDNCIYGAPDSDIDDDLPDTGYSSISSGPLTSTGRCDDQRKCSEKNPVMICEAEFCDGKNDCPEGEDELDCDTTECGEDEVVCDVNRCISKANICDQTQDCDDGTDERNCSTVSCPEDQFTCDDGKCLQSWLRCNGFNDCARGEDEEGCPCGPNEFTCYNGACIDISKQCDSRRDCTDNSDEEDCPAEPANRTWSGVHVCNSRRQFKCGDGACISILLRCDGHVDCPNDSKDELDCTCTSDQWQCDYGSCIERTKKCDGHVDCPTDRSDERDCFKCSPEEFQCNDGYCINKAEECDGAPNCPDGSDEINCPSSNCYMTCRNGTCIDSSKICNSIDDCDDGEDERDCGFCRRDEFRCDDGQCIPLPKKCNRIADCVDASDERDCDYESACKNGQFHCFTGECILNSSVCNGLNDCEDGSDEVNCECSEDQFYCDGKCWDNSIRCDGIAQCRDGDDERECPPRRSCENSGDYMCSDGTCIPFQKVCDGVRDCSDDADEQDCRKPISSKQCGESQFACNSGGCVPHTRRCDNVYDCRDFSDEQNCFISDCNRDEWKCDSGDCINALNRCDGEYNCVDYSDERDCPTIRPPTTRDCSAYEWRCDSGDCIDNRLYCNGVIDCRDGSDEYSCIPVTQAPPPSRPGNALSLNLKTYPNQQDIKTGVYTSGGEVVFQCRDESMLRARVKWFRDGGKSLPHNSTDVNGRLVMPNIQLSDSGAYVCQAVGEFMAFPNNQVKVYLTVEPYKIVDYQPPKRCRDFEATCASGECIPKSNVCNGKRDCRDNSDEISCVLQGSCEPNQFKCKNRRCVLNSWVCDGEDDCKDGSDEENCSRPVPGSPCMASQFQCGNSTQCIPKSFHCDGARDCADGSDEYRCSKDIYISKPPPPALTLNVGDTMIIKCEAVGVPTPYVIWRLNWKHVPEKCSYTSVNGIGTLTCPNVQNEDQGAYSCEALNNRKSAFATPDTILTVISNTNVCPAGFFNIEARQPQDCIACFCFGATTNCRSAELFTYQLPHPFSSTTSIGVVQSSGQQLQITTEPISQFDFRGQDDGGIVTRTGNWSSRNIYPYLSLQESYYGNQLTSYGGYIRYKLRPHNSHPVPNGYVALPDIIIMGSGTMIVHKNAQRIRNRETDVAVRVFEGNWQKITEYGQEQASRADIMIVLANVQNILLRAEEGGSGVDIRNFKMDSAKSDNSGLGYAAFVEQCECPTGYSGLSCQKCSPGYVRSSNDPHLGRCQKEEPPCEPGFYGSPNAGIPCKPCPCPLTHKQNSFANTCSLGPNGMVECDCYPEYEGKRCERCREGYVGNPSIRGDYCRPRPPPPPESDCDSRGTLSEDNGQCKCKQYAAGPTCSECAPNTFYLSRDNIFGCSHCFCSAVSNVCSSSTWKKNVVEARFASNSSIGNVGLQYWRQSSNAFDAIQSRQFYVDAQRKEVSFHEFNRYENNILYWSLPDRFLGDKVTSYGGFLKYTIRDVSTGNQRSRNSAPSVQLVSKNELTFVHYSNATPDDEGYITDTIQMLERNWKSTDGHQATREYLLMALSDVKEILIKATHSAGTEQVSLVSASLEVAEERGTGERAYHVENCQCPRGHIGTSCEDCAPGYTRGEEGLYLGNCVPCDCNDHSDECHPETGECYNCQDNTAGEKCDECQTNYSKDSQDVCQPISEEDKCSCNPDGTEQSFCNQETPYCSCKLNVEGKSCSRCKAGHFKLSQINPFGCTPCYCSGVSQSCSEAAHLYTQQIPSAIFDDSHGFTLTNVDQTNVINSNFQLYVNLNQIGYLFGDEPPSETMFWSLPRSFTGKRITSYGGNIDITQKFEDNFADSSTEDVDVLLVGHQNVLSWKNPQTIPNGELVAYSVPLNESQWYYYDVGESPRPVSRNDFLSVLADIKAILVRATLTDYLTNTYIGDVSMDTAMPVETGQPLAENIEICKCPQGYDGTSCEVCSVGYYRTRSDTCERCPCSDHEESCYLKEPNTVVCSCQPMYTGSDCSQEIGFVATTRSPVDPVPSPSIRITISQPYIEIKAIGSDVEFTCSASSQYSARPLQVTWSKEGGELPFNRYVEDSDEGLLVIKRVVESDSGIYICTATDGYSIGTEKATLLVSGNAYTLPEITVSEENINIYEGEYLNIKCEATGIPTPSITWEKSNSRPISSQYRFDGTYFTINSARVSDSGEYRCIASNDAGETEKSVNIYVNKRPNRPSPVQLIINPTNFILREGDDMEINCNAQPDIGSDSLEWTRENGYLPYNFESRNGRLIMQSVRAEDGGIYICSSVGRNIPPATVEIMIEGSNNDSSGRWGPSDVNIDFDDRVIAEGESVNINCEPSGYPLPIIKWTKMGSTFEPGTSQRGNSLVISRARWEDRGRYLCLGMSNDEKVVEKSIAITVERRVRPVIEIYPSQNMKVMKGRDVKLQCRVSEGYPVPEIVWDRPSSRPFSPNVHLSSGGVLSINNVDFNEEGIYTCTASNAAGSTSANVTIRLHTLPELTILPNIYLNPKSGSPVRVECRGTGYPEPKLYWKKISPYDEDMTGEQQGSAYLIFDSIRDEDAGIYECIGENENGDRAEERLTIDVDGNGRGDTPLDNDDNTSEGDPIYANEGETVEMSCSVNGNELINWIRADRNEQIDNRNNPSSNVLRLINITEEDGGTYECIVSSRYDNAILKTTRKQLIVERPPRITLHPPIQTVRPGDEAFLRCDATGEQPMRISWSPVEGSFPGHVVPREGLLKFNGIKIEDAGKYVCSATNRIKTVTAIAEVIVNDGATHEAPVNLVHRVSVNTKVKLECDIPANVKYSRIIWRKVGKELPRKSKQIENGILIIERVHASDAGQYECEVIIPGKQSVKSCFTLKVTGLDNSVSINPQNLTVKEGEPVVVFCRPNGESFGLRWSKESSRERVNTITLDNGLQLFIERATANDAGTYRCDTRDRSGKPHYEDFTLNVLSNTRRSAPYSEIMQDDPEVYSAALGSNVEMPCSTNMPPPIVHQWERPHVNLPRNINTKAQTLKLDSITESDAGPYICKTSNGQSRSEKKIILKVTHVVPSFEGNSYIEIKSLSTPHYYFDVEIAVKPESEEGIILYNSQKPGRNSGDFIALSLVNGVPEFQFSFGDAPTTITADEPISLNEWHIINISRTRKDVYMKVDGKGLKIGSALGKNVGLNLDETLYIGGVPDINQLPESLTVRNGFFGCIGKLNLDKEEISIMKDALEKVNINNECDSCSPNPCYNNAVCQGALTDRGYSCLCSEGYSGLDCSKMGDACRPGLCGPGRCADTIDGFKCTCPIGYVGDRCESQLEIEYPAFGGGAYIAYAPINHTRQLKMGLRIKPNYPVRDGLIFYSAESRLGHGHFTSLAVKDGYLEYRFDVGTGPIIFRSEKPLVANQWVYVNISRIVNQVKFSVEGQNMKTQNVPQAKEHLYLKTPLYIGGYDEKWLTINEGTGVKNGFDGCISDVELFSQKLDIHNNKPIQSANIRQCSNDSPDVRSNRGDIYPEGENYPTGYDSVCSRCINGGKCREYDSESCECPHGYEGVYCERKSIELHQPCDTMPCQGNGTCRPVMNGLYKCDCPLGTGGYNCHNKVELTEEVAFAGDGFLELPSNLLRHNLFNNPETIAIAFTTQEPDGVLVFQGEKGGNARDGDFILLQINGGFVEFQWELGEGVGVVHNSKIYVSDNLRHQVIVKRTGTEAMLEVDGQEDYGRSPGITSRLNADSNIYIGGTPSNLTRSELVGFNGCIKQIEFQETGAIHLGRMAVVSKNANPCSNSR